MIYDNMIYDNDILTIIHMFQDTSRRKNHSPVLQKSENLSDLNNFKVGEVIIDKKGECED